MPIKENRHHLEATIELMPLNDEQMAKTYCHNAHWCFDDDLKALNLGFAAHFKLNSLSINTPSEPINGMINDLLSQQLKDNSEASLRLIIDSKLQLVNNFVNARVFNLWPEQDLVFDLGSIFFDAKNIVSLFLTDFINGQMLETFSELTLETSYLLERLGDEQKEIDFVKDMKFNGNSQLVRQDQTVWATFSLENNQTDFSAIPSIDHKAQIYLFIHPNDIAPLLEKLFPPEWDFSGLLDHSDPIEVTVALDQAKINQIKQRLQSQLKDKTFNNFAELYQEAFSIIFKEIDDKSIFFDLPGVFSRIKNLGEFFSYINKQYFLSPSTIFGY